MYHSSSETKQEREFKQTQYDLIIIELSDDVNTRFEPFNQMIFVVIATAYYVFKNKDFDKHS